jgi:hypothetical protein
MGAGNGFKEPFLSWLLGHFRPLHSLLGLASGGLVQPEVEARRG